MATTWRYYQLERGLDKFTCTLKCNQCPAVGRDGVRCKRRSCIGVPFCWKHSQELLGLKVRKYPGMGYGLMAIRTGRLPKGYRSQTPKPIVFRTGDFIAPYMGEILTQQEFDRRYDDGTTDDVLAEYALNEDDGTIVDAACVRSIASIANTSVSTRELRPKIKGSRRDSLDPYRGRPITYITSVQKGTNCKFSTRTGAHDWHGVPVKAGTVWLRATKNIRESDQIMCYYGPEYRIYTTPGYHKSMLVRWRKRRRLG